MRRRKIDVEASEYDALQAVDRIVLVLCFGPSVTPGFFVVKFAVKRPASFEWLPRIELESQDGGPALECVATCPSNRRAQGQTMFVGTLELLAWNR
jgi:hypothetical protein